MTSEKFPEKRLRRETVISSIVHYMAVDNMKA